MPVFEDQDWGLWGFQDYFTILSPPRWELPSCCNARSGIKPVHASKASVVRSVGFPHTKQAWEAIRSELPSEALVVPFFKASQGGFPCGEGILEIDAFTKEGLALIASALNLSLIRVNPYTPPKGYFSCPSHIYIRDITDALMLNPNTISFKPLRFAL